MRAASDEGKRTHLMAKETCERKVSILDEVASSYLAMQGAGMMPVESAGRPPSIMRSWGTGGALF